MLKSLTRCAAAGLWMIAFAMTVHAAELAKPTGAVILTVTGEISNFNNDGKAEFDLEMLKAIDATSFATSTIWTTGKPKFTGVSLKRLLDVVGTSGKNLHSVALNDYAVDVPASDATVDGPILAYAMDDQPLSVRDKGPLWIVYSYDSKLNYRTDEIYSRSIWQLSQIEIQKK
jgi:hypothetical protein